MILKEQNGSQVYSDGNAVEQEMLRIAREYPEDKSQDYISQNSKYTINNTFSPVRHNLLNWYDFRPGARVLEVGAGMGAMTGLLCNRCSHVTVIEMNEVRAEVIRARYGSRENLEIINEDINTFETHELYDYVVFVGVLEYAAIFQEGAHPHRDFLKNATRYLKNDGILLFAIENRFGLKYWCGAAEDHLGKPYVGIKGYANKTARTFSRQELANLLEETGLPSYRFYYVLPDYKFPQLIFTDDMEPGVHEISNVLFTYGRESCLTMDEKILYQDIIANHEAGFFANSFLIEASPSSLATDHVVYVSGRGECKKEYRIFTKITSDKKVIKEAASPEAEKHIQQIIENNEYLKGKGIKILPLRKEGNKLFCEFNSGDKADDTFINALNKNDEQLVYEMIDSLKCSINKSSTVDKGILKKGFIDMTFYNAFWQENDLVFYDQEWCADDIPTEFIVYYAIKSIYRSGNVRSDITIEKLLQYAGVQGNTKYYDELEKTLWLGVLQRTGDVYGEDGYCNQYCNALTLDYEREKKQEELDNLELSLNNQVNARQELERELTEIKSSHAWGMMQRIWRLRDIVIPFNSRRRMVVKLIVKTICHPGVMLSKATPTNFRKLKYYMSQGDLEAHMDGCNTQITPLDLKLFSQINGETIADYPVIEQSNGDDEICVSIIIPVHNQFDYTYNCIRSIIANSGNEITYEIIIADDCSTDLTMNCESVFPQVKVIHNKNNLQFVRNCNNAARYAKGKYILFLNNDTQVQPEWIDSLVHLIESDETIGMVGSKLVYPNSELQEAGGIVWKDGTAWNYGKFSDATNPEYNYVKDVDYISGASIMLCRDLWEEIGGFAELYVPAYCEDTDLAFEVRARGKRVVYQPKSVVVHFEGKSNGTDVSSGGKHYQLDNQKKFYKKWRKELKANHAYPAEDVFHRRDRTMGKDTVLWIGEGDEAAMKYLISKGMAIKCLLLEPNSEKNVKLSQYGIETIPVKEDKKWLAWINRYKNCIDFVCYDQGKNENIHVDTVKRLTKKEPIEVYQF